MDSAMRGDPPRGREAVPEVSVRDLTFRYAGARPADGDAPAIHDLTFDVPKGQLVVIVGPSGCGKTTLLGLVGGLLTATQGTVEVAGAEPSSQHARMGYMPARDGLLPWRTAKGNVSLPLEADRSSLGAREREEKASELLDRLGLRAFEDYLPRQLSQGMRQRVSLARALVNDPELLLMDEPFGALDAQTKLHVQGEFLRAWEGSGRTVVFITHDLQEAILLADRIFVMSSRPGRIVADQLVEIERPRADSLHELFISPEFRSIYHKLVEVIMSDGRDSLERDTAQPAPRAADRSAV